MDLQVGKGFFFILLKTRNQTLNAELFSDPDKLKSRMQTKLTS